MASRTGKMMIPGGLSSEADFGDEKFFVQTEFAFRPKPRVTTTISVNGAVVEKVENVWERLPQTEEDQGKIEEFIKRQHRQVMKNIEERKESLFFVEPVREEASPAGYDLVLKVWEELSATEEVFGWVFLSNEQGLVTRPVSEPEDKNAEDLLIRIRDICSHLSTDAALGEFAGGILRLPQLSVAFLPLPTHLLAIKFDPTLDVKKLVQRVRSIT
jgi:hypothetical protein